MSSNLKKNIENGSVDALDFYKSLSPDGRETERTLIYKCMESGIVPDTLRYNFFRNTYRGIVKSVDGGYYYLHFPDGGNCQIHPADTTDKEMEASRFFKSWDRGCDLMKSVEAADDDTHEDEEKAGMGGGGTASLPPPSRPEDTNVATQDSQITEVHPGGTGAQTPQQDGSSERWHGKGDAGHIEKALPDIDSTQNAHAWDTNQLMKAWGSHLLATAPGRKSTSSQERQFMTEVLGKSAVDVDSGKIKLSPLHRTQYSQWLNKSLKGNLGNLSGWLRKSK